MKYHSKTLMTIATLFAVSLIGCGANSDEKKEKPQGVIPAYQLEALEKAKAVNKTMIDANAEKQKALEKL
jgi:hypothetical protein